MRIVRIIGEIPWRSSFDSSSDQWVAVCDALNLTTGGETWAELQANEQDAINLLFRDLAERGELEELLVRFNLRLNEPIPPSGAYLFDLASPTAVMTTSVAA